MIESIAPPIVAGFLIDVWDLPAIDAFEDSLDF
jgi:hypothetical protein